MVQYWYIYCLATVATVHLDLGDSGNLEVEVRQQMAPRQQVDVDRHCLLLITPSSHETKGLAWDAAAVGGVNHTSSTLGGHVALGRALQTEIEAQH